MTENILWYKSLTHFEAPKHLSHHDIHTSIHVANLFKL